MDNQIIKIRIGFSNIVIFRNIIKTKVIKKLLKFLEIYNDNNKIKVIDYYSDFLYELFKYNDTIGDYILEQIFKDDNIYINKYIRNKNINDALKNALKNELNFFELLSSFYFNMLFSKEYSVSKIENKKIDFYSIYINHINDINKKGYGIFYNNNMFTLDDKKNIIPAKHQDMQDIKQLYGYERERSKVIANTKSLLEGKKANNILLYGDAGTGKSSTIKAIANMFKDEGLRLIEVKKNQLSFITDIIEMLSVSPLKFIIFIDDLTFSSNDDTFSYLKAVLEGGVNSFPNNVLVYVTSNYRHLIKENFNDRQGDDIHIEDTIQQIMSLTNRFGIIITYQRPNKDLFSDIVLSYAKENNIKMSKEELIKQAESYAIRSAGRSPRAAKQFIETLL
ncbi:ATP-binding protein [Brachyspira murdochii]|uniref:ATP-binding protein n=1 Tax=Brachyspira murdochii TaxID=84378 RepID=UPI003004905E